MQNYTIEDGQYYKVTDIKTGGLISYGVLNGSNTLSTIHDVKFITKEQYESEVPTKNPMP